MPPMNTPVPGRPDRQDRLPQLYIAIGISGAIQHRAGMQALRAVSPFREPPAFFLVPTGPRIWRLAALLSSDTIGYSRCAVSPSHSRSTVASAFFAGPATPRAAVCFLRASSITVIASSQAALAFSSLAAAAASSRAAGTCYAGSP
jgi:Electron transfer flavoprotein FAD-binding domain